MNGSPTSANSVTSDQPEETTIYWLQPHGQRVGDQQSRGFSYREKKISCVTSWKAESKEAETRVLFALLPSVIGSIIQFIGRWGFHGSVSLNQIAATLIMTLMSITEKPNTQSFIKRNRLQGPLAGLAGTGNSQKHDS